MTKKLPPRERQRCCAEANMAATTDRISLEVRFMFANKRNIIWSIHLESILNIFLNINFYDKWIRLWKNVIRI